MSRTIVIFKVNGEIVLEKNESLTLKHIEIIKGIIAFECDCNVEDVEVETTHCYTKKELSDIDVNPNGLIFWKDVFHDVILGVKLDIDLGSDEYLDALINNTLVDNLSLFN
jgi:hypothetical protein